MKVAIVGAGAMGSMFGALLGEAEHEVWLVDVWQEHVDAVRRDGIWLQRGEAGKTIGVRATTVPEEVGKADLALVFVKSYHTEAAVRTAAKVLATASYTLTLQNGLGNVEKLGAVVGEDRVLAGVTTLAAMMLGPGRVAHRGGSLTHIGRLDGRITADLEALARVFSAAAIPTAVSDNVLGLIWSKLHVMVGISAVTSICRLTNHDVVHNESAWRVLELAVQEAQQVARRKGIRLIWADPVAECRAIFLSNAPNHRSSMLQDVLAGRQTEIELINGAIVVEGQRLGVPTPVNEALTLLVRAIEQTYDRRVGVAPALARSTT